jgi:dipeptidyl-peptidase-4
VQERGAYICGSIFCSMIQYTKRVGLSAFLLCVGLGVMAQGRKYTMAEATNGIATTLAPKSVKQPMWEPGTHGFYYVEKAHGTQYIVRRSFPGGIRVDTVESLKSLKEDLGANKEIGAFDPMEWVGKGRVIMKNGYFLQEGNTRGTGIDWKLYAELPKDAENVTIDKSMNIAYTVKNNLWLLSREKQKISLTNDAELNILNGQAVHRNEFGIDRGIFFSPKGNYLAYYRMDQTMVEDYPVIDWSVTPARNENVKYPMAGRTSHQVTLQVYNLATRQTTAVKIEGPKDQYLTSVTWSPDERHLYIAVLNRDQNHVWLNQYDTKTGVKVKTILQEESKKYVEPQHPLSFLPGSNTEFIWWSQRERYMHLWLCDLNSNKMVNLTPGTYVVNDLLGFNARRKEVLLTSAKEDPREKHGYAVNWETRKMRRLDTEPGIHNYVASDDGEYLFDAYSYEYMPEYDMKRSKSVRLEDAHIPKRSVVRALDGSIVKTLIDSPNPLKDYQRATIFSKTLTADDGTELYGRLILPTDFDAKKKYPAIVYLYNGPHVQLVKDGFPGSGNLWYEYLTQHGYIVWTMDGRGSSNRGLKFEQATFRKLGTVEMEDQLRGVEFLKSLPFVDASRMGIHGWSYGGFMTTSLMLKNPGVFKAAVAGGPVMDWSMYEIMYGERYMDTPEQNPEGYKNSALYDKAKNLKGDLLLIHGAQDATVVWQHSIKFLKAAVDEGIQVDYFVYPGYEHNVRGKDRVHLMQKVTNYFDDHL